MKRVALSLVLGLVASIGIVPTATAAGTTNGPVLYGTYLQALVNGPKTSIPGSSFSLPTQFSPDGASVATVVTGCSGVACEPVPRLQVKRNDGSRSTIATLPGDDGWSLAWSPDATKIAVLMHEGVGAEASIVKVDVSTGAVSTVVSTTGSFAVTSYSEISWSPNGTEIAFSGSELFEPNGGYLVHSRQIYVANATSGAVSRYNSHTSQECGAPSACPVALFEDVHWAPDGSRILARTTYDVDINDVVTDAPDTFGIATITRGAARPSFVAEFGQGGSFSGPFWSPDGTQVLFSRTVGGELVGGIVPAAGGVVTDLESAFFLDWQPCPNGTCAVWGSTATLVDSTITLNYRASLRVRVNGQVNPNRAGQQINVTLEKQRASGSWVTVGTKSQMLSSRSRYVLNFPLQNAFTCRATARYPGDQATKASSAVKLFSC